MSHVGAVNEYIYCVRLVTAIVNVGEQATQLSRLGRLSLAPRQRTVKWRFVCVVDTFQGYISGGWSAAEAQ